MDATPTRLSGSKLTDFQRSLVITKTEPVGRSSDSGEHAGEARLVELLERGDPLSPSPGKVAEDAETVHRLFETAGESACFGLTPDGHLTSHEPVVFEPERAAEQVIRLLEADMASEDRDEALAATWLGLAYHDHDHPADFGGLCVMPAETGNPNAVTSISRVLGRQRPAVSAPSWSNAPKSGSSAAWHRP